MGRPPMNARRPADDAHAGSPRGEALAAAPAVEPGGELLRWRPRALTILIWVAILARLPHSLLTLVGPFAKTLSPMSALVGPMLAAYVALALARKMDHARRAWLFLALQSVSTVILLLGLGLSGMGRLMLLVLPIYALVLLGRREGLIWLGLSVALYAGVTAAVARGVLAHTMSFPQNSTDARVWLAGMPGLLATSVPVCVLLERFLALLQRISDAERAGRARLQLETRERRLLESALLETSERERSAVGHELHDGVCQQLTAARLRCQVFARGFGDEQQPEAEHLRQIVDLLDESLGQAHELARGLSPGELDAGALAPALQEIVRRVRERNELDCALEHDGRGEQVDRAVATQLYRIAQEAVTNALKHASPSRIWIRLLADPVGVRLEVENDGRALGAQGSSGMGVRIMRSRAERVGGALALEARVGGGALVRCVAPLGPGAAR